MIDVGSKRFGNRMKKQALALTLVLGSVVPLESMAIDCPKKELTDQEVQTFVAKARLKEDALPRGLKDYKTKVLKMRCLYIFYEIALPESSNKYQTFTIDSYGEVVEFYRSEALQN